MVSKKESQDAALSMLDEVRDSLQHFRISGHSDWVRFATLMDKLLNVLDPRVAKVAVVPESHGDENVPVDPDDPLPDPVE